MNAIASRISGSKLYKAVIVSAMAAAAIVLASPASSASNEASWTAGCRGYWYSTAGHGYCSSASSTSYIVTYDCNVQKDTWRTHKLKIGYTGKFDSHECVWKINKTTVGHWV